MSMEHLSQCSEQIPKRKKEVCQQAAQFSLRDSGYALHLICRGQRTHQRRSTDQSIGHTDLSQKAEKGDESCHVARYTPSYIPKVQMGLGLSLEANVCGRRRRAGTPQTQQPPKHVRARPYAPGCVLAPCLKRAWCASVAPALGALRRAAAAAALPQAAHASRIRGWDERAQVLGKQQRGHYALRHAGGGRSPARQRAYA